MRKFNLRSENKISLSRMVTVLLVIVLCANITFDALTVSASYRIPEGYTEYDPDEEKEEAEDKEGREDENTASENTLSDNEAKKKERIEISSLSGLRELSENCHDNTWSDDKEVVLTADISLTGSDFTCIPYFNGIFDGNGYKINGYVYGGDGYVTGFFRYLGDDAVVSNINIAGTIQATGDEQVTGGIVGINRGRVINCEFMGRVEGKSVTGGIAGINEANGDLIDCNNNAAVNGYYFTGGICGKNYGMISSCINNGSLNESAEWINGEDEMNSDVLEILKLQSLKEIKIQSGLDTGGIAGLSKGLIIRCENQGTVGYPHAGYNVGGIAGRQSGTIISCTNKGEVNGRKDVGGIVGQMEPFLELDSAESLSNSVTELHDMIDKLYDDMDEGNATLSADFDLLRDTADASVDTMDSLSTGVEDYVNTNTDTINDLGDRADQVMEMAPKVVDNVNAASKDVDDLNEALDDLSDAIDSITDYKGEDKKTVDRERDNIEAQRKIMNEQAALTEEKSNEISEITAKYKSNPSRMWTDPTSAEDRSRLVNALTTLMGAYTKETDAISSIAASSLILSRIYAEYASDGVEDASDAIDDASDAAEKAKKSADVAQEGVDDIVTYLNAEKELELVGISRSVEDDADALNAQMHQMSDILSQLSEHADDYPAEVNDDLRDINDQLDKIYNIINDDLTRMEGGLEEYYSDISEETLLKAVNGKVSSNVNYGSINGDINVGGITGSMAIDENDPEENAAGTVETELGGRYTTQNILHNCINHGYVTAKNDGAGGIAGFMKQGIINACSSYGPVKSSGGSYVGGVAGQSLSVIKGCYSLCTLEGEDYIGGITGYGTTISSCFAMPHIPVKSGKCGAIAGQIEISDDTEELMLENVTLNYYVSEDLFGIDNINYVGAAERISYEELLKMGNCPSDFRNLKVRFFVDENVDEDEDEDLREIGTQALKFDDSVDLIVYPEIPEKDGYYGSWSELDTDTIDGNLVIIAEYRKNVTTVESKERESASSNRALALVSGQFDEDAELHVLNNGAADIAEYHKLPYKEITSYAVEMIGSSGMDEDGTPVDAVLRILNPYDKNIRLYKYNGSGWEECEYLTRGSYLEIEMPDEYPLYCVVHEYNYKLIAIIAASGLVAIAVLVFVTVMIKKKRGTKSK